MPVTVTIYNDDAHGHDIQVVQLNTCGSNVRTTVQEAGDSGDKHCQQYKLKNGELLIVSTAERVAEQVGVVEK